MNNELQQFASPAWLSEDGVRHLGCVGFRKTNEYWGGLSNMAGRYPLHVNGRTIFSAEALYQACRFPDQPNWQDEILCQRSPMAAKMSAKKDGRRESHSRADWDHIRVDIMRWVLRVKLALHYDRFGELLRLSGDRMIVEISHKDRFWGAVAEADGTLRGRNQLGRLLMELRQLLLASVSREELTVVYPFGAPNFLLRGQPIETVRATS